MPLLGLLALPGCEDDAPKRALARDARPAEAREGPQKGWVLLRPKKRARVPSPEKLRERVAGWRADTSAAETAPAAAVLPSAPKARKERAPKVAAVPLDEGKAPPAAGRKQDRAPKRKDALANEVPAAKKSALVRPEQSVDGAPPRSAHHRRDGARAVLPLLAPLGDEKPPAWDGVFEHREK